MAPHRPTFVTSGGITPSGAEGAISRLDLEPLRFLRRLISARGVRQNYMLRQTVKDNASSGVFLQNNPQRETIIISYTGGNAQRITLDPNILTTSGFLINGDNTPLFLTREAFGELVTAEWFYSGFDGLQLNQCITVIERIRI